MVVHDAVAAAVSRWRQRIVSNKLPTCWLLAQTVRRECCVACRLLNDVHVHAVSHQTVRRIAGNRDG